MVIYDKLRQLLIDKQMNKTDLVEDNYITSQEYDFNYMIGANPNPEMIEMTTTQSNSDFSNIEHISVPYNMVVSENALR